MWSKTLSILYLLVFSSRLICAYLVIFYHAFKISERLRVFGIRHLLCARPSMGERRKIPLMKIFFDVILF